MQICQNTLERFAMEDAKKREIIKESMNGEAATLNGVNPDYERKNLHLLSAEIVRRIKGSQDSNENCCQIMENLIREANL